MGARLECAGLDSFSARARPDIAAAVPPSEHPAMATDTGEYITTTLYLNYRPETDLVSMSWNLSRLRAETPSL